MMEINRHNYEAFLTDLLEGKLSDEDRQRLDDFLLQNPDCAIELLDAESWILESTQIEFRNKDRLRKTLPGPSTEMNDHNFDLFSIARMEGDLTEQQEQAYQEVAATDPERYEEWIAWQQTRLTPSQITYKGKDALKRKNRLLNRVIWMSIVSTAAAVALLVVLFRSGPEPNPVQQAGSLSNSSAQQADEPAEITGDPTIPEQRTNEPVTEAAENRASPEIAESRPPAEAVDNHAIPDEPGNNLNVQATANEPERDYTDPVTLASVQRLNEFSPAAGPVPDEIKALGVEAVPIHLSSLSLAQLSDMDLTDFIDNYREEKNFSLWTIANAGINGINKLAGSDISLLEARDETGEISGFQLKGKRFSVTRPIGQDE